MQVFRFSSDLQYYLYTEQTNEWGSKCNGNGEDLSADLLAPAVQIPAAGGPNGSSRGLDTVSRSAPGSPAAPYPLAHARRLPAGHQRPIRLAQSECPGDLSHLYGQHRDDAETTQEEPADSVSLQRETLLPTAVAGAGGEPGTEAGCAADGTRATLARLAC